MFRCWHRGTSCRQPARSAGGLERAAVRALELVRGDPDLRDAIRRELARSPEGGRAARRRATRLRVLERDRRRLLDLHYAGQISGELFAQEERRLKGKASDVEAENLRIEEERRRKERLRSEFEEVAKLLDALDFGTIWAEATHDERRVLVEDLLESVAFFPDHLEVTPKGAPTMNVLLEEVGLTAGQGDRSCRRAD